MKQRIGVMGGTFDPIHLGHLAIAEAAFIEFQLEKVIFIPAYEPVHKPKWAITEAKHRFSMTLLATAANPHFHASSIEIDRSGPSYTSETLAELKSKFGEDTDIFFILGADAIADLPTWHDARECFKLCQIIGAVRPGVDDGAVEQARDCFGDIAEGKIHQLATFELAISATAIRRRVQQKQSIRYIVPEEVAAYIIKERLYQD